jgi:molybdopterin synthase sulfur carrier subunit
MIRVRLFAALREATGQGEMTFELPEHATAEDAWRALLGSHPELGPRRGSLALAVNHRYARFSQVLLPGDQIVFIPPVSGG